MAEGFKVIAQALLPNSWATIYTVPASTGAAFATRSHTGTIISSMVFCNQHSGSLTYFVRIVPKGETAAAKHIIFNARALASDATEIVSLGSGLENGDMVDMYVATTANQVSVSIFGIQIS